ncbi:hypothetical protein NNO02_23405, partial [Citrobacter sp. Awk 2]
EYNFKDVVEGFNSYITRDELPLDRTDLLENISSMEKLSKENNNTEIFEDYLLALHATISKFYDLLGDENLSEEMSEKIINPFGKNALKIFKRAQVYSGFGAAIGKMVDFKVINDIKRIPELVAGINIENGIEFIDQINISLDEVAKASRKIGNAQRTYFVYFFRELLNEESDSFLNPEISAETAKQKYISQYV